MRLLTSPIILLSHFLAACETHPRNNGPYLNTSSLPDSPLPPPSNDPVEGSAIAFYATSNCPGSIRLSAVPEMPDGLYGPQQVIHFDSEIDKRIGIFAVGLNDGLGRVLARTEMPPGNYAIGGITCSDVDRSWFTQPGQRIIYATFSVVPGQTTYIGHINVDVDQKNRTLGLSIDADEVRAKEEFSKTFAELESVFEVQLAVVPE